MSKRAASTPTPLSGNSKTVKKNGKAATSTGTGQSTSNGGRARANGKGKKQAPFDLKNPNALTVKLPGDKKNLTAAQKVKRKWPFNDPEVTDSDSDSISDPEVTDSDSDSISDSEETDSDSDTISDPEETDSDDSIFDLVDYDDSIFDDSDFTVDTMDISSPEASPQPRPATKAAPKSQAARPTDRKRTSLSANNDANNSDNEPDKRVPRKMRRSLEQTEPVYEDRKAPVRKSLPERRKSLAANEAKSFPLPPKAKRSPRVDDEMPTTSTTKHVKQVAIVEAPKDMHKSNSIEEGRRILQWIMNPVKPDDFFSDFWEKKACPVQRKKPKFFSELISFQMIDEMLIRNHLEFTTDIDVTSYTDGKRQTLNPEGRAKPPTVWGFYGDGCSIRILNPSTYLARLRQMCSMLQEFFHCLVGANVYLTPPNSQGFAPHFDDIEVFVLQIEGRNRWRLYKPLQPTDVLARESSGNYSQEQLGEPILDKVLEAGDVLYFPRGTVHQAITDKDQHSLHMTLSVYQQQAYANLMEHLMPHVLQRAVKQSLDMRRGLPLHTWQNLGLVHASDQSRTRSQLIKHVQEMVQKNLVPTETEIDWAVDQVAKKFQHEALPPTILPEEKLRTVFGSRSDRDEKGYCICDYEFTDQTSIRLLRANILRLVRTEGSLRIYYYVDNALEYCKNKANFMEIEPTEGGAVETLIKAYPAYIKVSMLPLKNAARKIEVATALWERGLLMTEKPFKEKM